MNRLKTYWTNTKKSTKLLVAFTLLACGPSSLDYQEYFSLFFPQNAARPINTDPYFYSSNFLYEYGSFEYPQPNNSNVTDQNFENIDEWYDYLNSRISKKIISDEMYGDNSLKKLISRVKISQPKAAEYLQILDSFSSLSYQVPNKWGYDLKLDTLKTIVKANLCLQKVLETQDEFLKERYYYQAIRLNASVNEDKEVIKLFNQSAKAIKKRGMIYQWQKSWAAGSRMSLGDTGRAVLEFAEVFHDSPSKRYAAELSVRLCNTSVFEKALKVATTPEEKANIYALNAIQPGVDGLELAQKITKINPNHDLLELILSREINKNEMDFYADKNIKLPAVEKFFHNEDTEKNIEPNLKQGKAYIEKLKAYTNEMANNEKVLKKNFWYMSSAYLSFMKNDNENCKKILNKLSDKKDSTLQKQVDFIEFMIADKTFSKENEANLVKKIDAFKLNEYDFRVNNMNIEMSKALHKFYMQLPQNEKKTGGFFSSCTKKKDLTNVSEIQQIKAFLAINIGSNPIDFYGFEANQLQEDLIDTCSSVFLEKVISFINSPNLSQTEKNLIKLAKINPDELSIALMCSEIKNESFEKGLLAIKNNKKEELQKNRSEYYLNTVAKDFEIEDLGEDFDYQEYLEYLLESRKKAYSKTANAEDLYQYGKDVYNLSYYGKATELVDRYRSNYDLEYNKFTKNNNYYTTQNSRKYFEKALSLNPDKELAAKITYALALCQRNEYWVEYYAGVPTNYEDNHKYFEKMSKNILPKYRTYMALIRDKYADTHYQKMLLEECATYRDFVGRR
jgi:hypothetical protein